MRDLFISHAHEDKEAVARPLADALQRRGLSVWLDESEIQLGDPIRQKIEEGLRTSSFGVVILSDAFFAQGKYWPSQELDALFQKEVGGQKVILPVWFGLTRSDVARHSTLLAGRAAAFWSAGVDAVADAIVRAVTSGTPGRSGTEASEDTTARDRLSNLLIFQEDREPLFLNAESVSHDGHLLSVVAHPRSGGERAAFADLRTQRYQIMIGTFDDSHVGRLREARAEARGGLETWTLSLELEDRPPAGEATYNDITADRLAELRARLILLGDIGSEPEMLSVTDVERPMLLSIITGGFLKPLLPAAPIPIEELREQSDSTAEFLLRAKLWAVLSLGMSQSIERILRLELRLEGTRLSVSFEGRRPRIYSNQPPALIKVDGTRLIA